MSDTKVSSTSFAANSVMLLQAVLIRPGTVLWVIVLVVATNPANRPVGNSPAVTTDPANDLGVMILPSLPTMLTVLVIILLPIPAPKVIILLPIPAQLPVLWVIVLQFLLKGSLE